MAGITQDPKYDDYDFPTQSPINLSGHPGHTTPEQDAQVQQLRMMLEQAGYTKRLDTLTMVCCSYHLFHLFHLDIPFIYRQRTDQTFSTASIPESAQV